VASALPGPSLVPHLSTDRFRPSGHVVWARQADSTVLLDGERGQYYTLNEVASHLWELVVGGEPLMEILRCLREEYDVAAEMLESDVDTVLNQLLEADLIERIPP